MRRHLGGALRILLVDDLDDEPLSLVSTNSVDPETVIETFLGDDSPDRDGYDGSGVDAP